MGKATNGMRGVMWYDVEGQEHELTSSNGSSTPLQGRHALLENILSHGGQRTMAQASKGSDVRQSGLLQRRQRESSSNERRMLTHNSAIDIPASPESKQVGGML